MASVTVLLEDKEKDLIATICVRYMTELAKELAESNMNAMTPEEFKLFDDEGKCCHRIIHKMMCASG